MRVPLSWLAEFVPRGDTTAALADRLTMAGLGVEGVDEVGRLDRRIRAGRLIDVALHPGADRLQVCRVDIGAGAPVVIVSGAPGLAPGALVATALPGARLPGAAEVAAVELRGVASAGVLCSEAEVGLGDDATRVLELPADVQPGTPLVDVPGVADTVLELEITPNRGDWLSVLGVAREVAAITAARLRHPRPRPREAGTSAAQDVRLRVEAPDLCARYCARIVRQVRGGRSPLWLRLRLQRAGMRSIDALVDATNYVMIERGQPLHAFDLDRLAEHTVVVRRAAAGERIVTLDGLERTLEASDLVIADARRPIALAGVMGSQDSAVTAGTRTLLLESAFFSPLGVRRTARRLGISSQAAYRFERRVDPEMVPEALDAVAALVGRASGGRVAPGIVEEARGMAALAPPTIRLRPQRVRSLLGTAVARGEMARRLRVLGARCRTQGEMLAVTPPSYRSDLHLEEDLIEEVARVGGYDRIPTALPDAPMISGEETPERLCVGRVRRLLAAEGLVEMVTVSLTDAETNRRLPGFVGRALAPIAVRNPLSTEMAELRRSPLAGLLRALRVNLDRGAPFVGCFELGKGYGRDATGRCCEPRAVAVLLHGLWPARGAERTGPAVDFLDLKGVGTNLLAGLGLESERARWQPAREAPFLHPGKAATVAIDGVVAGVAGALHPELAQALDLPGEVWVAELDLSDLAHYVPRRVALQPLPRFPAVVRDLAVVVDESVNAGDILEEIRTLACPQIESVRLFDCYRGAPIPPGRKSLAYSIAYRASDRTLTDEEVHGVHGQVLAHLTARFRLELRS